MERPESPTFNIWRLFAFDVIAGLFDEKKIEKGKFVAELVLVLGKKELILEFQHVPCGVRQQKTARNLSGHGAGVDACPYFHPGSGRRPPVKEDLFCFRNFRRRQLRDKLPKFDMVSWLCACERMSM